MKLPIKDIKANPNNPRIIKDDNNEEGWQDGTPAIQG